MTKGMRDTLSVAVVVTFAFVVGTIAHLATEPTVEPDTPAYERPIVTQEWRDPRSGCEYLIARNSVPTGSGFIPTGIGITPRLDPNGQPICTGATTDAP